MAIVKEKAFYKQILILSLPIALQNIITFSVSLCDNIMVGSLGETSLSGVYVANQITTFLQMLVLGITAAMVILAAQYSGKGDDARMKTVVGIGIKFSVIISVILWIILFFFTRPALSLFTDEAGVLDEAVSYMRILCFGYPFFCATNVLIGALRCVKNAKMGMYTSMIALVSNVSLNYILIFGKLGFEPMGVRGAAIATVITRVLEFIFILVYLAFFDNKLKLKIKDILSYDKELVVDFCRYGMPVIIGDALWGVNMATQGAIVGRLGEITISAVSVANTVFQIISVGIYGVRDASSIIIGTTVGKGNMKVIKDYTYTLQIIFLLGGIVTGAALFFAKDYILMVWNDLTPETISLAKSMINVLSVTVIGTAYQMSSLTGVVRAGGDTKFVLMNDLLFVWLIVIPSSIIAAFVLHAPAVVVFACLKCDQVLKCIVAVFKINRFKWIKNITR
ncbi:MAG: MATE family efflux transporter [Clostridia bacterium]|nr:MATE family efflux transporter [Clostridia bacterium]